MLFTEHFALLAMQVVPIPTRYRLWNTMTQNYGVRIINNSQPVLQHACTVVFYVVCGHECFVETSNTLPNGSWCKHKRCRATVDLPTEHVHRSKRVVPESVLQVRCIAPYYCSCFFEQAVEADHSSTDGTSIRTLVQHLKSRRQRVHQ